MSPPPHHQVLPGPFPQGVYDLVVEADLNNYIIITVIGAAQQSCCLL